VSILLTAHNLSHSFGAQTLFSDLSLSVTAGARIGLIGPNGAGKSTLFKILAGRLEPVSGTLARQTGLRVAALHQAPTFEQGATVREAIASGSPHGSGWETDARVDELLGRLDIRAPHAPPDAPVAQLSGGWQKRVALATALIGDPDLLLLDEPTNHLDIESILWLEGFISSAGFATVTITHDRAFLQKVSTRIWELDRTHVGGLLDVAGDYATFLSQKEALLSARAQQEASLRNRLQRETEWLRRGPAARTTKQKARIDRAHSLSDQVSDLQERSHKKSVRIEFGSEQKKPRRLIEARGLGVDYGTGPLFEDLDLFIGPGTRLGILGRNGCGKSTLLRALLGTQDQHDGQVLRADDLQVATFEQDRSSLHPARTLADTVCPDGDYVDYRGTRVHRNGYLARFGFSGDQANVAVGKLSGGEQARILVARLMLRPANLLVLDEPTNDLDMETLAVLEEALTSFAGAVLLVSHDRYFVDQVCNKLIAFHASPGTSDPTSTQVTAFSDLAQWDAWLQETKKANRRAARKDAPEPTTRSRPRKKLSCKDQRDRDTIEARIEEAEATLAELTERCADPDVVSNTDKVMALQADLQAAQTTVDELYARWEELEALVAP